MYCSIKIAIFVSEIEKIEQQIELLEQELSEIPSKKVDVLHKHFN